MNWLFDNFYVLLVIGFAIAGWIRKRAESKEQEEQEQRAREEIIRSLEQMERAQRGAPHPSAPSAGPPVSPAGSPPKRPGPPPLKPVVAVERSVAQPVVSAPETATATSVYDFQARLEAARRAKAESEELVRAAKAAQGRTAKTAKTADAAPSADHPALRAALKNRRLTRQAIVMREILGPPLGMRS